MDATHDERIPLTEVLPGKRIHPLDEGWVPLEAFILIKCRDENGRNTWSYRTTAALNLEELLGALTVQVDLVRRELLEDWRSE